MDTTSSARNLTPSRWAAVPTTADTITPACSTVRTAMVPSIATRGLRPSGRALPEPRLPRPHVAIVALSQFWLPPPGARSS
eukprot:4662672-Lingulodinium_polyedra.AAC.1